MRTTILLGLAIVLFSSCLSFNEPYQGIAPGVWRAEIGLIPDPTTAIERRDAAITERDEWTEGKMPFNFEVIHLSEDSFYIEIINGEERIQVTDIQYGTNPKTARDSFRINFPVYDTYIHGEVDGSKMDGEWVVPSRANYRLPFTARLGQNHRFTTLKKKPVMDLSGRWPATFQSEEKSYQAVGHFAQEGNQVTGTFMTETGDFRYLHGTIQANKLYLSAFDGSHAFLFEALIDSTNKSMEGIFRSGKHYYRTWTANQSDDNVLSHPDSLVKFERQSPVTLEGTSPSGKTYSLNTAELSGKAKILTIMGTWCPNCLDEGAFLSQYKRDRPDLPLAIIGLAFEKYDDTERCLRLIENYKKRSDINYDIWHIGKPNRDTILSMFPQMENFVAYPTMLFLDKENRLVKVHTGFNGPATPEYDEFKRDFQETIELLMKSNE